MMPVTGSNMKRQVNPMAMGEMNTGMTISVRNNPMPRIRVSSRSAKKNPSAIWTETTTTHQDKGQPDALPEDVVAEQGFIIAKPRSNGRSAG